LTVERADVGIIGGSGLYEIEGFTDVREVAVDTPFGPPSDRLVVGRLEGRSVAFLPRHARGHRLLPSELNYQANVFALKTLGVERILSVSAVGSLKEKYVPLHIVIPEQLVDRTTQRRSTFFGRGLVAHVAFADPFCPDLSRAAAEACREAGATFHTGGTYVCIEGPQFSTRAESELYRSWGMDIIGMTNLQEAKLAREAEICYTTIALVTDYDSWHPEHDQVTVDMIVANLMQNARTAQQAIASAVGMLPFDRTCECATALKHALITRPEAIPDATKKKLAPIVGRYL
jgi:5'-methylthioadenosine phosphorylase